MDSSPKPKLNSHWWLELCLCRQQPTKAKIIDAVTSPVLPVSDSMTSYWIPSCVLRGQQIWVGETMQLPKLTLRHWIFIDFRVCLQFNPRRSNLSCSLQAVCRTKLWMKGLIQEVIHEEIPRDISWLIAWVERIEDGSRTVPASLPGHMVNSCLGLWAF